MNVLAVGLSHRTADLATLERAAVAAVDAPKLLHELHEAAEIHEVMLVSTCNRIEVYALVESFHGGLAAVSGVLTRHAGVEPGSLAESLYVHYAGAAVHHAFSVASGLDSVVLGETQIRGQLRTSYAAARDAGTVGTVLHGLVQATLRVSKRVHADAGLGAVGASVVSRALDIVAAGSPGLGGQAALIVGAGSMGSLVAARLRDAGIGAVTVANRTEDKAARLAASLAEHGVRTQVVGMDALPDALAEVDLVVSCTGARDVVLHAEQVAARAAGKPLVLCDLALPRDIDPGVTRVAGVRLVDLETVRAHASAAEPHEEPTELAAGIVCQEVEVYLSDQRTAEVTPTVTALRERAATVVAAELSRLDCRLPDLDDAVRAELDRTVRRVVGKLLHAPTVRVKQLAADPAGTDYAGALRELFGLDPGAPAALSAPTPE